MMAHDPMMATAAAAMRGCWTVTKWLPTTTQRIKVAVANTANVTLPMP